jgi:hypothetical protein
MILIYSNLELMHYMTDSKIKVDDDYIISIIKLFYKNKYRIFYAESIGCSGLICYSPQHFN